MSKNDILTATEMAGFRPNPEVMRYVLVESEKRRRSLDGLRVLDWGCGRGRFVMTLLRKGVDCYGVDIDPSVIDNSRDYFTSQEQNSAFRLRVVREDFRTDFPDEFFDVVVSDNVLEHVADLGAALAEIFRVTKHDGWGFHLFPARFTLREGHLHMPFVHWLPKNGWRRNAIRLFTSIGIEPGWSETRALSLKEKTTVYYSYSRDKTFYRSPKEILKLCRRCGFSAKLVAKDHPRVSGQAVLRKLTDGATGALVNWIISECKTMELLIEKSSENPAR